MADSCRIRCQEHAGMSLAGRIWNPMKMIIPGKAGARKSTLFRKLSPDILPMSLSLDTRAFAGRKGEISDPRHAGP